MKKKGIVWVSMLVWLFFISTNFLFCANVYYVSPAGKDSNPGTETHPWASPAYGAQRLKPGDTLIIKKGKYILGDYEKDRIRVPSGKPDAWVIVKGEKGTVLAGKENLATIFDLSGTSYVRIEDIEITSVSGQLCRDGIEILEKPAHHIVLQNLYLHHLDEFGMNFQDVQNLLISHCRIAYCGFGAIGGPAGKNGGWKSVQIFHSELSYSGHYYQGRKGHGPYERPDGFGIEASEGPIEIAYTVASHNRGDGLDSKAAQTYIHHCTVANNSCDGIKLWGDGSRVENTLVYGRGDGNSEATPWSAIVIQSEKRGGAFSLAHLTVDDEIGQNYLMYVQYDTPDIPLRLTIENCIFSSRGENAPIFIGKSSTVEWRNNLFFFPRSEMVIQYGEKIYRAEDIPRLGWSNLYAHPLFVDTKNQNYTLLPQSPAIDSGRVMKNITNDRENIPRPQGKAPDCGAYEVR
ncbi:MAG: right-handed parallel beta-helix repeat-containing protein [Brevinematales bacterium]|nr:right-handed parallel beta-helix repeat-containing protein [Brevinematales bacterium]